jgi:hypothetical protein
MWQVKKVVLLATSRIYVQNLIPFGKFFDEIWFFVHTRRCIKQELKNWSSSPDEALESLAQPPF